MAAIINPMDLSGRRVLVTGASSGIGRDTCILLSELGARVVLVARDEERLQETLKQMRPGDHLVRAFDITRHDDTSDWMSQIAVACGPLFGLVHLAGISHTEALRFLDLAKLDEIIDVNLKSAFSLCRAFRQKNVRVRPQARIVLVSSVSAIRGYSGMSVYAASKGGVYSMVAPLAHELAREDIRVNCVVPGLVRTEMAAAIEIHRPAEEWAAVEKAHPLGVGQPRDVSQPIAFLLSAAANWMTGQALIVDGGLTM
jgi:NAD(P)-dependent dehydrogenase (short-subunit alcohol dehydrogenase family)